MMSDALKRYYATKVKRVPLDLYGTDDDIKQRLEEVKSESESVQAYLKRLIREDIARAKK